jgi:hypothetical protein
MPTKPVDFSNSFTRPLAAGVGSTRYHTSLRPDWRGELLTIQQGTPDQ